MLASNVHFKSRYTNNATGSDCLRRSSILGGGGGQKQQCQPGYTVKLRVCST